MKETIRADDETMIRIVSHLLDTCGPVERQRILQALLLKYAADKVEPIGLIFNKMRQLEHPLLPLVVYSPAKDRIYFTLDDASYYCRVYKGEYALFKNHKFWIAYGSQDDLIEELWWIDQ